MSRKRSPSALQRSVDDQVEARKHGTYDKARASAQVLADAQRRDVGLEWLGEGQLAYWHVFGLPNTENRCGHELRCEVVHPVIRCGCAEMFCRR